MRKRVSGPEHLDTLAARSGLARWTQEADGEADPGVKCWGMLTRTPASPPRALTCVL